MLFRSAWAPNLRQTSTMRSPLRAVIVGLLGIAPVAAFAQETPLAARGQHPWITFRTSEGGLYYFDYSLRLDADGHGEVTMTPRQMGAPDTAGKWSASFQLTPAELARLEQLLARNGLFTTDWQSGAPIPCGPAGILHVTRGTREVTIPEAVTTDQQHQAEALISGVRDVVPPSIQTDLNAKWRAFIDAIR